MKKTKWLDKSILPIHVGTYEVNLKGGEVELAVFTRQGWSCEPELFNRWRGRNVLLSKDDQKKHRAVIAQHGDTLKFRKRAAKSALRLARDAVASQKSPILRSEFYSIAIRLNAKLDETDLHQNVLACAEVAQEQ